MKSSVKVSNLCKVFALKEGGNGAVSLRDALRQGKPEGKIREVNALVDVSFQIKEGERLGIIGPNGAGKTTLLSLLAGLTEPTSGVVEVVGSVHAMLTIGAVLKEEMTGRENIYVDAAVHGSSREKVDAVVEDIIEFTELGEFIERPVRTYSSGMKARLAFSMGAFIDPDILILDETLAVGDAFFAEKASRRMKEVASRGKIVILVSHSSGAIVEMCTRCLWIDNGKLVMDGDPKEVTTLYEASVRDTDEKALARKFEANLDIEKRTGSGLIEQVDILQKSEKRNAVLAAMVPLTIQVSGTLLEKSQGTDLKLKVLRVDNRKIWETTLCKSGRRLPDQGHFNVRVTLDPFIFGSDLYRLEVSLVDSLGICDASIRVFEVVDEEGQFGGQPLLYYSPQIETRQIKDTEK